jgi:DNA-binding beta-propeller fold protein YncE
MPVTQQVRPQSVAPLGDSWRRTRRRTSVGWRLWTVVLLAAWCTLADGLSAQEPFCSGDCDGNEIVNVSELITAVGIALGSRDVRICTPADFNRDGQIAVEEIVRAVRMALGESPCVRVTIDVPGVCQQPGGRGSSGLRPCDVDTIVNAYRCVQRDGCLAAVRPLRELVGSARVGDRGLFTIAIDRDAGDDAVVLESLIVGAKITELRAIVIGPAGNFPTVAGATPDPVAITPFTEAALLILEAEGLENFSDQGVSDVVDAVGRAAAIPGVYDDVDAAEAVMIAFNRANDDPEVDVVIAAAMQDRSPTPTSNTPPTPTRPTPPTATVTRTRTPTPTLPPPRAIAYVAIGSNRVALVDLDTEEVDTLQVGNRPVDVSASPDGRFVLVANADSDTVTVIDARAHRILGETPNLRPGMADAPKAARMAPSGTRAFVVNSGTNLVDVFDISPLLNDEPITTPVRTIPVGDEPIDIAIVGPPLNIALVTNHAEPASLSVIDIASDPYFERHRIPVPNPVSRIAVTPDGTYAYITTEAPASTREVLAIDVVRAAAGERDSREFSVGSAPSSVAILPDGSHVFVVTRGDPGINVIERTAGGFGTPRNRVGLQAGRQPNFIALTGNGRFAYITNLQGSAVTMIDTVLAIVGPLDELSAIPDVGTPQFGIAIVDKRD